MDLSGGVRDIELTGGDVCEGNGRKVGLKMGKNRVRIQSPKKTNPSITHGAIKKTVVKK